MGREAVIHRRSRPQLSNSAARCLDKSGQTWLLSGLVHLSQPRFGPQVSPGTEASGDAATWVRAARAGRTLAGDMLKIPGKRLSGYLGPQGF